MPRDPAPAKLAISYRAAADLIPYARNSRIHSESQIAQIAASIEEFGWTNPILIDERGEIIAGHGRLLAAEKLGIDQIPCIELAGLSAAQRKALVIADNKLALNAGWDEELLSLELADLSAGGFEIALLGFDEHELADLGLGESSGGGAGGGGAGSLSERFMMPPFSVLNAREGRWQERKREWLSLGIKSEIGRGENLLKMSETILEPDPKKRKRKSSAPGGGGSNYAQPRGGRLIDYKKYPNSKGVPPARAIGTNDWVHQKRAEGELGGGLAGDTPGAGTSIFDPVLCELAYRWFCPAGGLILDPFAGGSVRGIVAAKLGRQYLGHELRPEQCAANREQAAQICGGDPIAPAWIEGDSRRIDETCAQIEADFIFSCPPYADLERYSDDPADLSTLDYAEFLEAYREIIAKACARLKEDRFACFVVGDIRDKAGNYRDFPGDTSDAFRAAGLSLYNEAILITACGSLAIRAAKQFSASRKLGKSHQNVLCYLKGDAKRATAALGKVDVSECLKEAEAAAADLEAGA
jgi:DNA modification methylase